ncbi:glutathione peroxidase [Bacillus taeanensis]|uniref:Glutathione peroxidase n=1 Tax=Bacillus taeanensis TaxID=273032 RepID=A0A366XUT3_9BACI|nr:glutathione peroxidase [Bacillus taeanensis]RBW69667.1 glutathione peroxidase [Bacillus taeanensis]
MSIYSFSAKSINGENVSLEQYRGKTILIVNTASKCGFTSQYKGLQTLYEKYHHDNFVVLGFPCDQFGSQEPGTEDDIKQFCKLNYGVSFPMFAKVEVKGENAHPLFTYLTEKARGVLHSKAIKWNFTKFLVSKEGEVVKRFAPKTPPEEIESEIKHLL